MQIQINQPGVKLIRSHEGSALLQLSTKTFSATLSLSGGQLLRFQQHDADPLLYLSPGARLKPGCAIRGGIPICWPWFGAHPELSTAAQHGIARSSEWTLQDLICNEEKMEIRLKGPEYHGLSAEVRYYLDDQVKIELITKNQSHQEQCYSAALHSYLALSDVRQARIHGLAQTDYFDKITNQEAQHQEDSLPCAGEIDQIIYTSQQLELSDPQWKRRILIETAGSASMVLWNPGATKAQQLQDLPDDGWRHFFCVEAANAAKDARSLQPGAIHTLSTRLHTIPL